MLIPSCLFQRASELRDHSTTITKNETTTRLVNNLSLFFLLYYCAVALVKIKKQMHKITVPPNNEIMSKVFVPKHSHTAALFLRSDDVGSRLLFVFSLKHNAHERNST